MTSKNVHVRIGEMETRIGHIKNLELSIGKVIDDSWAEPMGRTHDQVEISPSTQNFPQTPLFSLFDTQFQ